MERFTPSTPGLDCNFDSSGKALRCDEVTKVIGAFPSYMKGPVLQLFSFFFVFFLPWALDNWEILVTVP